MTATEVATRPFASVRVNCYDCERCLFAAEELPEGGAQAVFDAAGCSGDPRTCPGPAAEASVVDLPAAVSTDRDGIVALGAVASALPSLDRQPVSARPPNEPIMSAPIHGPGLVTIRRVANLARVPWVADDALILGPPDPE